MKRREENTNDKVEESVEKWTGGGGEGQGGGKNKGGGGGGEGGRDEGAGGSDGAILVYRALVK